MSSIQLNERATVVRRGRLLEYLTIIWNLLEGIISVGAGFVAGSIALVGFGLDSFVESLSGGALLWRLHLDHPERRERAELIALRIVGFSFLMLAVYVGFDAVKSLVNREAPEVSYVGIAIATLSLVVMPWLARAKRRVALAIKSRALEADACCASLAPASSSIN
jgi:divalent metal cation (Fe/Co/Zn/Cd) transporter